MTWPPQDRNKETRKRLRDLAAHLTASLLKAACDDRQSAGPARPQPARGPDSLSLIVRKDIKRRTGVVLTRDGEPAGTSLETWWKTNGWQSMDELWAAGAFQNAVVVRGRLPGPHTCDPAFGATIHGDTLRIDSFAHPDFYLEIDLTSLPVRRGGSDSGSGNDSDSGSGSGNDSGSGSGSGNDSDM